MMRIMMSFMLLLSMLFTLPPLQPPAPSYQLYIPLIRRPFGRIVYLSVGNWVSPTPPTLYVSQADGVAPQQLRVLPSYPTGIDWAPNRQELIVSLYDGLYRLRADGTQFTQLHTAVRDVSDVRWSPDGMQLVFAMNVQGNVDLYRCAADGSGLIRLTMTPSSDTAPSWSPDGQQIVYSARTGGTDSITVLSLDSTRPNETLATGDRPSWSPDGRQIAFVGPDYQLELMEADGSNRHVIKNGQLGIDGRPSQPRWSPDGRYLAVSSSSMRYTDIQIIAVDGSGSVAGIMNGREPAWEPHDTCAGC